MAHTHWAPRSLKTIDHGIIGPPDDYDFSNTYYSDPGSIEAMSDSELETHPESESSVFYDVEWVHGELGVSGNRSQSSNLISCAIPTTALWPIEALAPSPLTFTRDSHPHSNPGVPFYRNSRLCLDGQISDKSEHVVASGGYADVWTGSLDGVMVAIKTMRVFSSMGAPIEKAKMLKRLWREFLAWSTLSHPNILKCLGFSYDFVPRLDMQVPSLISPWMSNGSILSYIQKNPDVDRLRLVVGIAQGLSYLHNREPQIIHGDLRAGNVLVSDSGVPFLTDFGLSRSLGDAAGMTTSSDVGGSLRWMSPELFHNEKISEASDVWAYGMTVLEVITGKRPYHNIAIDPVVLRHIMDGQLPLRPDLAFMTDGLWGVCTQCWELEPFQRPSIREVTVDVMAESHVTQFPNIQQQQREISPKLSRTMTPTSLGPSLDRRVPLKHRAASSLW
ncbi:kinase-like protein [Ramaria rubella]|nr:kinase-like protein [Ramaria rubella]